MTYAACDCCLTRGSDGFFGRFVNCLRIAINRKRAAIDYA